MTQAERILQVRYQIEGAIALVNALKVELATLPPVEATRLNDKLINSTYIHIDRLQDAIERHPTPNRSHHDLRRYCPDRN